MGLAVQDRSISFVVLSSKAASVPSSPRMMIESPTANMLPRPRSGLAFQASFPLTMSMHFNVGPPTVIGVNRKQVVVDSNQVGVLRLEQTNVTPRLFIFSVGQNAKAT